MWRESDGVIHTVVFEADLETLLGADCARRVAELEASELDALVDRVPALEEEVTDLVLAEPWTLDDESQYRELSMPEEMLREMRWEGESFIDGLREMLQSVPLRWRLDYAGLVLSAMAAALR
jgi:hypothetical protein